MKMYLIGAVLLLMGCQPEAAKPPMSPEQPIVKTPIVIEEPVVPEEPVENIDCSAYDRVTDNPAINEWLKKELEECEEN